MSAVCVRCGSERTEFWSNEAAIMSVKASRSSLAHPEDSQQCRCGGEFIEWHVGVLANCSLYPELSEKFLLVTCHLMSNYARNLNEDRNAPVGYALRRLRKIGKSDCLLNVCPSVRMYLGSHWTDLHEIWVFFRKSAEIIQVKQSRYRPGVAQRVPVS